MRSTVRRQVTRWRPVAASAAIAAAAVLIGVQATQINHLDNRVNKLASTTQPFVDYPSLASALLDPAAKHIMLTSTTGAQPVAQLVVLPSGNAFLVGGRLSAIPATRTYQLWAIAGGRAISVGLLGTKPTTAAFSVDPNTPVRAYLVTVEHAGGAIAPTAAPVAHATT
jgi:anti-sigma-K factor RskA